MSKFVVEFGLSQFQYILAVKLWESKTQTYLKLYVMTAMIYPKEPELGHNLVWLIIKHMF